MDNVQPSSVRGTTREKNAQAAGQYIIAGAVLLIAHFQKSIIAWLEKLERQHYRGQRLAAYRRRHEWKKGDIPHLESLGVTQAARSRMARVSGRGRPVVKPHRPLDTAILETIGALQPLFDEAALPQQRRQAFKSWRWWDHFVEALYRGEHELAKGRDCKGPSTEAEYAVGAALGISQASVHAICGKMRKMRADDPESANFPRLTLADYERWMQTGICCWD